jgi:hypothetical protein
VDEETPRDRTEDEETEAAAADAASIGGPGADTDLDPAERPVVEQGGGEAEGFERSEAELIEHASHGDPAPDPTSLESEEREHPEPTHGAADHEHSTEVRDEEVEH